MPSLFFPAGTTWTKRSWRLYAWKKRRSTTRKLAWETTKWTFERTCSILVAFWSCLWWSGLYTVVFPLSLHSTYPEFYLVSFWSLFFLLIPHPTLARRLSPRIFHRWIIPLLKSPWPRLTSTRWTRLGHSFCIRPSKCLPPLPRCRFFCVIIDILTPWTRSCCLHSSFEASPASHRHRGFLSYSSIHAVGFHTSIAPLFPRIYPAPHLPIFTDLLINHWIIHFVTSFMFGCCPFT